jgi:hypothetical protein
MERREPARCHIAGRDSDESGTGCLATVNAAEAEAHSSNQERTMPTPSRKTGLLKTRQSTRASKDLPPRNPTEIRGGTAVSKKVWEYIKKNNLQDKAKK